MSQFLRSKVNEKTPLALVCLLVHKAGLQHLIVDAEEDPLDAEELECLAAASDIRLIELVTALANPDVAMDFLKSPWEKKKAAILAASTPSAASGDA